MNKWGQYVGSYGMLNLALWIYPFLGIENTIEGIKELRSVRSKEIGEIFSIEMWKYACLCKICIIVDGCKLDKCEKNIYMKKWKYAPFIPKGSHPILMWQEMHIEEVVISLDYD